MDDFAMLADEDGSDDDDDYCGGRLGEHLVNPEDGCLVLLLKCSSFSPVPPSALGMRLHSVSVHIAVEQSLRLRFVPVHRRDPECDGAVDVEVSGLRSAQILPWHYPQYEALCREV